MKIPYILGLAATVALLIQSSIDAAEEETVQVMSRWLSQTPDVARDSYDSILPSFSPDGATVDKTYEFVIESRKATVRTDKPIPLSQVRDVTLLREVQKELRLQ